MTDQPTPDEETTESAAPEPAAATPATADPTVPEAPEPAAAAPAEPAPDDVPTANEYTVAFSPQQVAVGLAIIAGLVGLIVRRRRRNKGG